MKFTLTHLFFCLTAIGLTGILLFHFMSLFEMETGEILWPFCAGGIALVLITVSRVVASSPQRKRMNWFLIRIPLSDYWKHAPKWLRIVALVLVAYGIGVFTYIRATYPRGMQEINQNDVFAITALMLFVYAIPLVGLFPAKDKQTV